MLNEKLMTSDERRKHMGRIKLKDTKPECLVPGFVDHLDIPVTGFIEETLLAAPIYVLFLSARLYS